MLLFCFLTFVFGPNFENLPLYGALYPEKAPYCHCAELQKYEKRSPLNCTGKTQTRKILSENLKKTKYEKANEHDPGEVAKRHTFCVKKSSHDVKSAPFLAVHIIK
jgi:hypothetical protein